MTDPKWREKLALGPIVDFIRDHKVQPELATRKGWMYVFGLATFTAFLAQVITGVGLATMYVPTPADARSSLLHITDEVPLGALLRAMHFFGASAMLVLVFLHMARVFLTGSYKAPRQMNWVTGVLLLFLVLTMALTGQLLRWDENGMWTVVVAAKFAERTPLVGNAIARFFLAGAEIGGPTLTRAYALHVLIVPGTIFAFVGLHLYLLVQHGVSEPPTPDAPTSPKEYVEWYEKREAQQGVRYVPHAIWREIVFAFVVVLTIVTLAVVLGPKGLAGPGDPTQLSAEPKPDWFVRWYYALLYFKPRGLETLVMVYLPIGAFLGALALPFVFGRGRRALRARPWAPLVVVAALLAFGVLTVSGLHSDWTPAYDVPPFSPERLGAAPEVREGARLFHEKGCLYCHRALGRGGLYGPDLSGVTVRLSREDITARIVQGFRDMPAYRDALTEEELDPLLAFLMAAPDLPRQP